MLVFLRINLTINVAHPVFLMHTQSLLSGYAPAEHKQTLQSVVMLDCIERILIDREDISHLG